MNTKNSKQFTELTKKDLSMVIGGAGYRWRCSDGFSSAWHAFRNTAESNAKAYERIHNATCSVFHD